MATRKRHVLFVDDDPDIREGLQALLESRGVQVTSAADAESALRMLVGGHVPDIIIADIELPGGMDGFEFYSAVRANREWLAIPFIILTAHRERDYVRKGQMLGVDGYLTKPVNEEQLVLTIYSRAKRAQELTRYAEAEHERLEYIRRDMARTFTHELRTPMAFLKPVIELLNRYTERLGENTEMLELIDSLEAGYTRLERLLEQMTLLMQWDTGELQKLIYEARRPGPLWDALTAAVNRARAFSYRQPDVMLRYNHGDVDGGIMANWKSLTHALAELLSNALAFSPKDGKVEVTQWQDNGWVYLSIADQGPGIPKAKFGQLFRRFNQVEREKHEQQGIGMGLYLARGIIEANGGALRLVSEMDRGTTLVVGFPLLREGVPPAPHPARLPEGPPGWAVEDDGLAAEAPPPPAPPEPDDFDFDFDSAADPLGIAADEDEAAADHSFDYLDDLDALRPQPFPEIPPGMPPEQGEDEAPHRHRPGQTDDLDELRSFISED